MRFCTFILFSVSTFILSHAAPLDEGFDKRTGYGGSSRPPPGFSGPLKRESDILEARNFHGDIEARGNRFESAKGRELQIRDVHEDIEARGNRFESPGIPREEFLKDLKFGELHKGPTDNVVSSRSGKRHHGEVEEGDLEGEPGPEEERRGFSLKPSIMYKDQK